MDTQALPTDINDAHALIIQLQGEVQSNLQTIQQNQQTLAEQSAALEIKDILVAEQAHSLLELKDHNDKLDEKVTELNLRIEKLLQQLYGRKSERRVDGAGQLLLDLGEEASPEVVSALEEAIREAEQIVQDDEDTKQPGKSKRPRRSDRKFPEHLPRTEQIIDLPEDVRDGLKFIGYDEVETLYCKRQELYVIVRKYAKYAYPADPSQGIVSPERPTGLVEGDRFDASIGVEVVAWKYFYHMPFYRQQDLFAGTGWTPSRSTLANIEAAVEFALRPLADYLRGYLKTDQCVGCDDTGVLLITPKTMPDLSEHPRKDRITEVLSDAIEKGKPSIKARIVDPNAL